MEGVTNNFYLCTYEMLKPDIENREAITELVNKFYSKVMNDDIIGYIFKNIPGFTFEKHVPIMVSFWETLLFGTASYKGNPMEKHIQLNKLIPLEDKHFVQWLALWAATIKENFEGTIASQAIQRSMNIAAIMQVKINS